MTNPGQLAAITTTTTLLGAGAAAALGQNPNAAVTGASNETLNNTCADGHDCGQSPPEIHLPEISPGQDVNPADPASEEKALAQEGEVAAFGAAGAGTASAGAPATASQGGPATNESSTASSGVDLYVNFQGTALPSTGYRYMGSQYAEQTKSTMTAPLSYFGFTNYKTASEALSGYQIDPIQFNNDATLKGTFDTLQLFGPGGFVNAKIPLANGGAGPGLEPYTSSYPELGTGGQAQLVPALPGTTVKLSSVSVIPKK